MTVFNPYLGPTETIDAIFQGFLDVQFGPVPYANPANAWASAADLPFLSHAFFPQFNRIAFSGQAINKMDCAVFTPYNAFQYRTNPNAAFTGTQTLVQSGIGPQWYNNVLYAARPVARPNGTQYWGLMSEVAPLIGDVTWGREHAGSEIVPLPIVNPGAETGDTSGWTITDAGFVATTNLGVGTPYQGSYYFYAGLNDFSSSMYQDINIPASALAYVPNGTVTLDFEFAQASTPGLDFGKVDLEWYDALGALISTVPGTNRAPFSWTLYSQSGLAVPTNATRLRIVVTGTRQNGSNDDAAFDAFSGQFNVVRFLTDTTRPIFGWPNTYGPVNQAAISQNGFFIGNEIPGMIYSTQLGGPQLLSTLTGVGAYVGLIDCQRSGSGLYSGDNMSQMNYPFGFGMSSVVGQVGFPSFNPSIYGTPMYWLGRRDYTTGEYWMGVYKLGIVKTVGAPVIDLQDQGHKGRIIFDDPDIANTVGMHSYTYHFTTCKAGWIITPINTYLQPKGVKNGAILLDKTGTKYWIVRPIGRTDATVNILQNGDNLQYAIDLSGNMYFSSLKTAVNPNMDIFTSHEYILNFDPLTIPVANPVQFPCMECPSYY